MGQRSFVQRRCEAVLVVVQRLESKVGRTNKMNRIAVQELYQFPCGIVCPRSVHLAGRRQYSFCWMWKTGSCKRRILPILHGFKVLDSSWLLDPDLG